MRWAYFSVFTFATFAAFGYARMRKFLALMVGMMFLGTLWLLYVQAFLLTCILPVLPVLSGDYVSHCRTADRHPALTTPTVLIGCRIAEKI